MLLSFLKSMNDERTIEWISADNSLFKEDRPIAKIKLNFKIKNLVCWRVTWN